MSITIGPKNSIYDDVLDTRIHSGPVASNPMKDEIEKLQKMKAEYDRMKKMKMGMDYGMDAYINEPSSRIRIRSYDELEKNRNHIKDQLERLNSALEKQIAVEDKIKDLPFQIGDAVFHKEYGNMIITGIDIIENTEELVRYITIGRMGEKIVPAKECLPVNETTKVLYGNK